MQKNKQQNRDLNDLTRSVLYEEIPNQNLMRLTIAVIALSFLLFVGWSSITQVNEVAKTEGEIIPSGYAQVIQHLEGGIVSGILVEEGDLVEQGQVLVRMGGVGAEEDFAGLESRQTTLKLQAERLRALAYDKAPDFAAIAGDDAEAIAYQQRILEASQQAYAGEADIIKNQLAQKDAAIERLSGQKQTAQNELESAQEVLNMKTALNKKGSVSRKEVIDSERDVNTIDGNIGTIEAQIAEAEQALGEYQNRLTTLNVQRRDRALQELEQVETQIAQNNETLDKLEGRVERMAVKSPVRGIVQGLRVNTVGGVIGAGEPIMEIVPLDRTLIVEARIPPRDIGNLRVGQPARVKVSAFDFSRYGVIEGELEFLSATTFVDENKNSYYKGRIVLDQNHVGSNPDKNLILPGMTVESDIVTGEKTILAYLLKPIHTSLNSAFTER